MWERKMNRQKANESGRSMVEMLGVIAIIGVISVGAITSMSYVDSYFRTSATLMEVEQIARDVNDAFSWAASYQGLSNELLCDEKIVENCDANEIPNRWGGILSVQPSSGGQDFILTLTKVPKVACERITEQASQMVSSMKLTQASCTGSENRVEFKSN